MNVDDAALDRFIVTVETLEGLYARANDDGDPVALEDLLAQLQSALDQIEQLRTR